MDDCIFNPLPSAVILCVSVKQLLVYFVSHIAATHVAFWVARGGQFASHFAMRYRLVRTLVDNVLHPGRTERSPPILSSLMKWCLVPSPSHALKPHVQTYRWNAKKCLVTCFPCSISLSHIQTCCYVLLKEIVLLSSVELSVVEVPAARSAEWVAWVCQSESRASSRLLQRPQGQ